MKIALIGNQNSGKTTLFNKLTKMNQKIGNWPGVTVEKKSGIIYGTNYEVIDLPGIYSFSPYTIDEKISQDFVLNNNIDLIINVVDSCNLERSLYLTTQLLELDCKVIIALNMIDLANDYGINIDINMLKKELNADVCCISAQNGTGVKELITLMSQSKMRKTNYIFKSFIEEKINFIQKKYLNFCRNSRFIAIRILEGKVGGIDVSEVIDEIEKKYNMKLDEIIAASRYEYLDKLMANVVNYQKKRKHINDLIDAIVLNKYMAFPIFIFIMFFIYYMSISIIGGSIVYLLENSIVQVKETLNIFMTNVGVYNLLRSLVIDGIVTGVGTILSFVPQLAIFSMCISILEESGYMSRVAFIFDSFFRKIGLSGKSVIPFIVGLSCSVPGIMATRIIENDRERMNTAKLVSFIPCNAKLPIIALFCAYFFKKNASLAFILFYVLSIIVVIVCSCFMNRNTKSDAYCIFELPSYKIPNLKNILMNVVDNTKSFLKKAGSVILVCSVLIWFLLYFSPSFEFGVDVEESILANIGKKISWIFVPILGVNSWQATMSILQGLIAKEQVISSMAVILEMNNKANTIENLQVYNFFNSISACSFVIFNLFSIPCFNTIITLKKELNSNLNFIKTLIMQLTVAYILSTLFYQIGSALFL